MEENLKNIKKTKICCLNLDKEICDYFSKDFDVYDGSLGKMVDITEHNKRLSRTNLLLNYDFPDNLHEYDVFVIDLRNIETVKYKEEEHTKKKNCWVFKLLFCFLFARNIIQSYSDWM